MFHKIDDEPELTLACVTGEVKNQPRADGNDKGYFTSTICSSEVVLDFVRRSVRDSELASIALFSFDTITRDFAKVCDRPIGTCGLPFGSSSN